MFGLKKKKEITRLLVMRFSAIGDVAMTVPVLACVARQNPHLRITMLTRKRMAAFCHWLPSNVVVNGVDLDEYQGVTGMGRLYGDIKGGHFDAVCDLHDVLRTKYLRTLFKMGGVHVSVIDKGRKAKHELLGDADHQESLRPMVERYADVFRELGLKADISDVEPIDLSGEDFLAVNKFAGKKGEDERWIGVAPFAAHAQKIYPLERMHSVVRALRDRGCRIFLFGAGEEEDAVLREWEEEGVVNTCGRLGGLHNEMLLISRLDTMVSMDSANMHIASLMSIPVVSIWGATHPKAGFNGFGQMEENIIQVDLPCRPCSIYGNKPCRLSDLRCMDIKPEAVVERVLAVANKEGN